MQLDSMNPEFCRELHRIPKPHVFNGLASCLLQQRSRDVIKFVDADSLRTQQVAGSCRPDHKISGQHSILYRPAFSAKESGPVSWTITNIARKGGCVMPN